MFVIASAAGASFLYYIWSGQQFALMLWVVLTSLLVYLA